MREILFKAKRTDTDTWTEGNLLAFDSRRYIINDTESIYHCPRCDREEMREMWFAVIPETVSEYIGLTDKNGRKIFEHDLLKDEFGFIHEVYFDDGCFMRKLGLKSTLLATTHQVFEVVGNTFDNPELLKINNKLWSESV